MNSQSLVLALALSFFLAPLPAALAQGSGSDATDGTFGPYLQNATPTGAIVCWRTRGASTSEVEYGTSTSYGRSLQRLVSENWHQIPVTGLSPDTRYYYRATSRVGSSTIWTETGSFRTSFESDTPFRFVHMAETHDEDAVASFREEVLAAAPHLIVDSSDQVDEGGVLSEWDHFFTIGESFYRHVVLYDAPGNHSYVGTGLGNQGFFGNIDLFRSVHAQPGNEEWYSIRYGKTLFLVLNSTWYFDPFRLSTRQVRWLKQTLAEATDGRDDPTFKVAVYHVPSYSSGPGWREVVERPWTRHFFVRHFRRYGVDLVLAGHDKFTEHSKVDGIHYVQVATGHLEPSIQTSNPGSLFLETSTRSMTIASVSGKRLSVRIVDASDRTMHSFEIAK